MKTPTLNGLKEYALKRGDAKINNNFWWTCAIGEYLRSLDINLAATDAPLFELAPVEHMKTVRKFHQELESLHVEITYKGLVNNDVTYTDTLAEMLNDSLVKTYQQLVDVINTGELNNH